jgi:glucose/arabinose dehydrogenase
MKLLLISATLLLAVTAGAQVKLVPHQITLQNGRTFSLNLPAEFEIIPAAEGLTRVRFFARSPDGRIFVTDMRDLTDNKRGSVYILDGFDSATGKFGKVTKYLSGLHNPNSCQFYRDAAGQDWFYLAETDKLTRRKFTAGEIVPNDSKPQVLATFPDYGLSYKYGGWHLTRTIAFSPDGKLYVSVGSSCNACAEKEKVRASIIEMDADGRNQHEFARGLRNAVGLHFIDGTLYATNQGSDHLGLQKPDETFYALKSGADYGWPYCHSSEGKIFGDPQFKRAEGCRGVPEPNAFFPAHASALGFERFGSDSPDAIKDAFLVALHGSTNKAIGHGYKIVVSRKSENPQDLITGFLAHGTVMGRPCDILKLDANSFLFTDDNKGIVYLVRKKGATTNIAAVEPEPSQSLAQTAEPTPPAKPEDPKPTCLGILLLGTGVLITLFG